MEKLVQLIARLSKSEKRSFRLFVNRNPGNANKLYMQLFDLISKSTAYSDEIAAGKIEGLKKSQLSNLKANLYKQILSCLRLVERNKIGEIQLREQIDFAKILYEKGLYLPCLDLLEKAKKQAIEMNYETIALSVLYFEKRIESQHITGSMSAKADELSNQSTRLLEQIELTNKLSNASLLLYGRYLRHGYVKSQQEYNDLKVFFENLLPAIKEGQQLEFYQQLYLYQSYVWFYNMAQGFANCFKYAQKWVHLFESFPEKKNSITILYLKGLHNLLNALFMASKRKKFNKAYNVLVQFDINAKTNLTRNELSNYNLFYWIHFLNKIFINAGYNALEKLKELETLLKENTHSWDLHRLLVFYYKIGSVYFAIGDYDAAITYLSKIVNENYPDFRSDIQSFARILFLICHFDKGEVTLVTYQVKSLYRYLSKMEELGAMQLEVIKFLRRTPKMFPADMKEEFTLLRDKLITINEKPFEKRPFFYLDIIAWLDSKISKVKLVEVLQAKV